MTETGAVGQLQHPPLVVYDTNVLLSLFVFSDSRFAPLRSAIEAGRCLALTSAACLDEFRRVLNYPQFGLNPQQQNLVYTVWSQLACSVETVVATPPPTPLPRCKDQDDQKFLELARDGRADWLVSADKMLLKLRRRQRLAGLFRILSPEEALGAIT